MGGDCRRRAKNRECRGFGLGGVSVGKCCQPDSSSMLSLKLFGLEFPNCLNLTANTLLVIILGLFMGGGGLPTPWRVHWVGPSVPR